MRNITLLCLVALLCQSCFEEILKYASTEEGIKLNDFTATEKTDYKSLGTYYRNTEPIYTHFKIDTTHNLAIVRLGKDSKKVNFSITGNKSNTRISGTAAGIAGNHYHLKYFFNDKDPEITAIKFNSDGVIIPGATTDILHDFNATFANFELDINDGYICYQTEDGLEQTADFAFYKKNGEIYLLILTSLTKDRVVKKGTLYNYLTVKT